MLNGEIRVSQRYRLNSCVYTRILRKFGCFYPYFRRNCMTGPEFAKKAIQTRICETPDPNYRRNCIIGLISYNTRVLVDTFHPCSARSIAVRAINFIDNYSNVYIQRLAPSIYISNEKLPTLLLQLQLLEVS